MKNHTETQNTINNLQHLLQTTDITLPIYLRFRTSFKNLILSVNKVTVDDTGIKIFNGDPTNLAIHLNSDQIISIEALCDSNRRPVFIKDFNEPGEIILDEISYES